MPKCTNAEMMQRVREVKEQMLLGKTRCDLLQYAAKWNLEDRAIDDIVYKAREELSEINSATFLENRMLVLKNYWETYQRALNDNNVKEQRAVLDSIAKVTGLEMMPAEQPARLPDLTDAELDKVWQEEAVH